MTKKILVLFLSLSFVILGSCSNKQDTIRRSIIDYGELESDDFTMNGFTLVVEDGFYVSIAFTNPIFSANDNNEISEFEFELITSHNNDVIYKMDKNQTSSFESNDKMGTIGIDLSKDKIKSNYEDKSELYQEADLILKVQYFVNGKEKTNEIIYPQDSAKVEIIEK